MNAFAYILKRHNIQFSETDHHIRHKVQYFQLRDLVKHLYYRCFLHIVILACKAVLGAITSLKLAAEGAEDYDLTARVAGQNHKHDQIAMVQTLVWEVQIQTLSPSPPLITKTSCLSDSFLFPSTPVLFGVRENTAKVWYAAAPRCWYPMVINTTYDWACDITSQGQSALLLDHNLLTLSQAICDFLKKDDFKKLQKLQLTDEDWDALNLYQRILEVCLLLLKIYLYAANLL